jgi:ATP/maltotriose-dependent transcriptional regulator MalT
MAYRTSIEILLRENRTDTARQVAEEALSCIESFGGSAGYSEVVLRLSIAEARAASGDMDAARGALAEAARAMDVRAVKIPDPEARARYLTERPENVRVRELASAWLGRPAV